MNTILGSRNGNQRTRGFIVCKFSEEYDRAKAEIREMTSDMHPNGRLLAEYFRVHKAPQLREHYSVELQIGLNENRRQLNFCMELLKKQRDSMATTSTRTQLKALMPFATIVRCFQPIDGLYQNFLTIRALEMFFHVSAIHDPFQLEVEQRVKNMATKCHCCLPF